MTERDRPPVTIVTEYFYPEQSATAQLLTELAVELTDDYDVKVLTGRPNYHDTDRTRQVPHRENYEGVEIRRLPATRFDKDRLPLRVVNWLTFTLAVAVHLLRNPHRPVLAVSNPPILPFAPALSKRGNDTPYAYLIHDMYPDMPVGLGVLDGDGLLARAWERAMRLVYRDADRVVVLGESMERRLTEKMADDPAFDPEKVRVIPNWEDGELISPKPKADNEFAREHDLVKPFVLLYSGNVGRYHELQTAIRAIERLENSGRTDIELLVIGEGARKQEHREYVRRNNISNVRFLPFQPKDRLPETLTACDASLVGIDPEMEGICVSSKLYSSLAAGRPVLAVVAEGDEVARVVREHDCGRHVQPGDVRTAVSTLERWADDPEQVDRLGSNARRIFDSRYRKPHAVEAYASLFEDLTKANRS
jgi:glycosyltransferase involved in cell wall biosynthesis